MRYELTDDEWAAIRPMLPNRPRGIPRRERPPCPERHPVRLAPTPQPAKPTTIGLQADFYLA